MFDFFYVRYLKNEHAKFCVPSNISSGLASLPLSYVYINGNNTGEQTTKELPTGEKLDGKDAYKKLMPYFTTNDMTPDDVHKMGIEMLNKLYPEVRIDFKIIVNLLAVSLAYKILITTETEF